MITVIEECIREMGVTAVLKRETIVSHLNLYTIIYRGIDTRFHKLQLFYNESDIFGFQTRTNLIGVSDNSLKDKIKDSITTCDSLKECSDSSIKLESPKVLTKFLDKYIEMISDKIKSIDLEGIKIRQVKTYLSPVALTVIHYEINGIYREPIKFFLGNNQEMSGYFGIEKDFVDSILLIVRYGGDLCRI